MVRVVVDIDDTLCHTSNRDWDNAAPAADVIAKVNALYNEGAYIILCTARGSISCKSREEADAKYRAQIEAWMYTHGVLYSELSFDKVLGDVYVDDKACTVQSFTDKPFAQLQGGMSGAPVFLMGDYVVKEDPNSYNVAQWATKFNSLGLNNMKYPPIYSVTPNSIYIKYIQKDCNVLPHHVHKIVQAVKSIPGTEKPFTTYILRIKKHLEIYNPPYTDDFLNRLRDMSLVMDVNESFCHGDLSYDNMICSNHKTYVIDPIVDDRLYSSWLLDISKFYMSTQRFDLNGNFQNLFKAYSEFDYFIKVLSISHWIRFRKYAGNTDNIDTNIRKGLYELT